MAEANRVDDLIRSLGDWRGATLQGARELIKGALPTVTEETKWVKPSNPMGVPTWSKDGLLCTGEVYKDKVKLTFARGAALADPRGLFNASLEAGTRRAIDLHQGDVLDREAFTDLIRAAAAENLERRS